MIALNCVKISRTTLVGVALAIFAGTVWLYWPSVHGGFLTRMDDDEYLRQSVRLNGLTWSAVKWAFTATQPYYHPLPRLSHVLDYQMWGKNAAGHHATSVIVHALNAALVFGFVWALLGTVGLMTGERFAMALGVAVVFAIHPFQAESVAWMSGRTQLLCTTFGVGCLWAYVAGARRWAVWGLFVAALLCKPMAVSLPFVMLAIDYFPLRRHEQLGWNRLVREKAVLMALGVLVGAVTMITESQSGGLLVPLETISATQRVFLMFRSLTFYPWRLVCPVRLTPVYPLAAVFSVSQWPILISVAGVGIVTGLVVWYRRQVPALAASWAAYVMLVLPVSGLMQTGSSAVALRYAYLAMVPLLLVAGGAVVWLWRRSASIVRVGLVALLACEMCVFGVRTRSLIPVWHDDETLWRTVLAKFPDSGMANGMYAAELLRQNRIREAVEYGQRAIRIEPEVAETQINLGVALFRTGRSEEAIPHYEQALRINPDYAEAYLDLGSALFTQGRLKDAITQYEGALRHKPDYAEAYYSRGVALEQSGSLPEAIADYEEALKINPDYARAHFHLGAALEKLSKPADSIRHYEEALRTNPDYVEAHFNLGRALEKLGRTAEAIEHYQQALKLRPDFTPAKNALARLQAGSSSGH